MESLMPSALVLDDVCLHPERYSETWIGERLELRALVTLHSEEHTALRRLVAGDEAISVVRHGISEEPRSMEMLNGPWSEQDGTFRWLLRLEDVRDDDRRPNAGVLEMARVYRSVPYLLGAFDGLAKLLVEKAVISQEESKALKEAALEGVRGRSFDLLKVQDVQQFWDEEA